MNKNYIIFVIAVGVLGGIGYWVFQLSRGSTDVALEQKATPDSRNAVYLIEGKPVKFENGKSTMVIEGGAASMIVTKYFGNEAIGDFNGDGINDVAFLLTRNTGGTGTFYYVAALLSGKSGFTGSNAILLGDRIAPQTTEYRNTQIVVNYADRKSDEPMTVLPSVSMSRYFFVTDGQLQETDRTINGTVAPTTPDQSVNDTLRQLFVLKYPKYEKTISVALEKGTKNFIRGGVSLDSGVSGGIFLAAKIDGKWQIVFDGNGQIPCDLSRYGFPGDMLSDCAG